MNTVYLQKQPCFSWNETYKIDSKLLAMLASDFGKGDWARKHGFLTLVLECNKEAPNMKSFLSKKAMAINPSPTLTIDAKAKELLSKGIDVVGFGAGEPDFDTPEAIKSSACKALEAGHTKYTPASGTLDLKKAVCTKMLRDQNLQYEPKHVVIGCGAKHVLYNLFQVICNPGDEVLLPAPYWVSYSEQVSLADGKPVIVATQESTGFKLSPEEFKAAITPRTKAIVLNSPSNPTGSVYTREELQGLADIAVEHGILVVSDEIYEKLIYDGDGHISIAQLGPEIKELTFIVNGVSKTFSMTGWRIGYGVGNAEIIKAMSDLQSHSTSNPTTFCQTASVEALVNPPAEVESMVAEFKKRRDYMVERVQGISGLSCNKPSGAFYVFANISGLIGKSYNGRTITNGDDLAELLLEQVNVAVVPGSGFGTPEYIRLSYAISMERIKEGLDRIAKFIENVQ